MSYQNLYDAVKKAYAREKGSFCQQKTNELWNELKKNSENKKDLYNKTAAEIKNLNQITSKRKAVMTNYFLQVSIFLFKNKRHLLFFFFIYFISFFFNIRICY